MAASLFEDPLFQMAAVPAIVAFLAVGFFRLAGGLNRGTAMAGAAIAFGLLSAYLFIQGMPPFPPVSSSQKLPYLILGGLVLGAFADAFPNRPALAYAAIVVVVLATVVWFGLPQVTSLDGLLSLPRDIQLTAVGLTIGGLLVLSRLYRQGRFGGDAAVMLGVAALALAPIAFLSNSASYAQMAVALAAAVGGFYLWNWPRPRYPLGVFGVLGAGLALLALSTGLLRFTAAGPWPFLLLILVFYADMPANRPHTQHQPRTRWYRPLVIVAIAALPAFAAVGAAYWLAGQSMGSGY